MVRVKSTVMTFLATVKSKIADKVERIYDSTFTVYSWQVVLPKTFTDSMPIKVRSNTLLSREDNDRSLKYPFCFH